MIIVIFHALYLFGKYVYENFNNRKEKTEGTMVANQLLNVSEADYGNSTETEDVSDSVKVKFFPPVYVQRYNTVQSVLTSAQYHGKIQKVIDFGCAELSFAIHLKNTDGVKEIYCIDVDRSLLEHCQTKVAPLHCDYLSLRTEPLTIHVCEGSIAHNDNQLANTDAVICIELIEHLYPDDLESFPYNVFGFIKPQVAIITTPNSDFNVLFRLNGFRHADHKFEWTRAQFQDWATNIVLRYPDYEVSFHGIGSGPDGTEHLGSCSQMAVFHRHIQLQDERPEGVDGLLKTVVSYKYPYRADNRSDEEKILSEAEYYIRLYSARDEELSEEIPLEKLMFSVEKFRISTEILRVVLEEANWSIADRENGPVVIVPPQSTFSLHSDADLDDFLDNDYRHHGNDDDWDALEPRPPHSAHFLNSYMEQDLQNDQQEENWDDEEPDTRLSSSQNLNSENLPNSELHVPENVDHTLDSQWIVEDLNNGGPLLVASQHQPIRSFGTETELPSDSFSIGVNSMDINHLGIPLDTLNSSQDKFSSRLSVSPSSETSNSPSQVNVHLPPDHYCTILLSHDEVACRSVHNETSSVSTEEAMCLLSHEEHLLIGNEEILNNGREVFEQSIDSVALGYSTSLLSNDRSVSENYNHYDLCSIYLQPSTTSNNSLYPNNEDSHLSMKELSSATNESYNNLDHSHDGRYSSNQNCQTDLINTEYIESQRIKSQDSMSLQSISESSLDLEPKYTSSPQIVTDIHEIQAQSDNKGRRLSDTPSLHYSQTIESFNIKDSNPEDTYRTDTKMETKEAQKLHSSIPKMILLCTNDVLTRDVDILYKESSLKAQLVDENNALRNRPESKMVENISPSPSELSLQSNSDISLSTATSTGSSSVEKWYAAETNPMYQRDLVVLKGGNDKPGNPEEETTAAHNPSLDRLDLLSDSRPTGFSKQIRNEDFTNSDILGTSTGERTQLRCKSISNNEISTSYNVGKIAKEQGQLKCEFDHARGLENSESKPFSPESLDTPPNSWSPEIMDSGYPNSASVHDVTPEYDLSSIANDRISDSDSASVGEVPVPGFYEFVEVENGDLANNNRDDEGNNVIAFQANDIDDLQPLIDVLENDMENENDIYVLQNGFPLWLLRILEMANPIDLEGMGGQQVQLYPAPLEQAGGDAPNVNVDDEGFDSSSSSSDDDDDDDSDIEDDEADDATTVSSDETEDQSAENLRRDWRAGGDP